MPRLNQHFSDAIFLLYEKDENEPTDSEKLLGPSGSGVIIRVIDHSQHAHFYAVTAGHVVAGGASIIRLNTDQGLSRPIDIDPSEWTYDLSREDLAIVDISDRIQMTDLFACVDITIFVSERFIGRVQLGIGEDGFMLGLFTGKEQKHRNEIAARFGNISLLADTDNPVPHNVLKKPRLSITTPCHVFDMHSRPGFSGSPVFVYRTPDGDLRNLQSRTRSRRVVMPIPRAERIGDREWEEQEVELLELEADNNKFLRLLGIHVAQFDETVRVKKGREDVETSTDGETETPEDAILRDQDVMRFPGSMTIVVPADRIAELLENKDLVKQRKERTDRLMNAPNGGASIAEPEAQEKVAPVSDNPAGKEDFTSLQTLAAKTPARDH